jgi:hypothetical protein
MKRTIEMTLRSFYRAVAVGTVSTLGVELALSVFSAFMGYDLMNAFDRWSRIIWPPLAALILFLTIGGIVLWLGMISNCASARKMSTKSRTLWLVLIVLTPNLGALIYYFCVFGRRAIGQEQYSAIEMQA